MIIRPGSGLDPAGVGYALITAAATVIYHLLSRVLAKSETTMALLFHTALVGTIVFGALLPWSLAGPLLLGRDIILMVALGGLATLGHFLFTAAYREAPASLLSPVNYLHLVWGGIFGWVFFDHIPDGWSQLGIAMVAAAGIAVALRTHLAKDRVRSIR